MKPGGYFCPARLSLAGGGTDLPSFSGRYGGQSIGFSIALGVTVVVQEIDGGGAPLQLESPMSPGTEAVHRWEDVRNPHAQAVLRALWDGSPIRIRSTSSAPAGIGLGTSSAFSAALASCLRPGIGSQETIELCHRTETEANGGVAGWQDQVMSVSGGFTAMTTDGRGAVVRPLRIDPAVEATLNAHLMLFRLAGRAESADGILREQVRGGHLETLLKIKKSVPEMADALTMGDMVAMGRILTRTWHLKRTLSAGTRRADRLLDVALAHGAYGGKGIGAGGRGIVMVLVPPSRHAAATEALRLGGCTRIPCAVSRTGLRPVPAEER